MRQPGPVTILGQGIAGSLLAWELRQRRIPFRILDPGRGDGSSLVGAGIMNPITGQRLVPSWRWSAHLPIALEVYRGLGDAFGEHFVRPFRIQRLVASRREERILASRIASGELRPHVAQTFPGGCWIEGAWQLDSRRLVCRLREMFRSWGVLEETEGSPDLGGTVICCTGAALQAGLGALQPVEGAVIEFQTAGLEPGVILNRGVWVLPLDSSRARAGSTYWKSTTTAGERAEDIAQLSESVAELVRQPLHEVTTLTGWRVTTPDKHPVAGWLGSPGKFGVINGLGAKGALHAPALARMWADHLDGQRELDAAFCPTRFSNRKA
ncbi:MAG: FAD-dependent oxidoreductase [Opitutaceae bacterium]|nr:FAD-dependent oxidoreductase [Opitutaceae bacterium]